MMFNDIKYLFFDVGYTLVNEDDVWKQRCIEQSKTDEAKSLCLSADEIFNEVILAAASFQPQFKSVITKFNFKEIAPYRNEFERLYDGAKRILFKLSQKFKLGIIANQSDGLQKRLKYFGIDKFFNLVISSWDFSISKPDIRLFKTALRLADCLPENAIMIGDRLENDIAPAKLIGMKSIWIKQGFGAYQKPSNLSLMPDAEVGCLNDLLMVL